MLAEYGLLCDKLPSECAGRLSVDMLKAVLQAESRHEQLKFASVSLSCNLHAHTASAFEDEFLCPKTEQHAFICEVCATERSLDYLLSWRHSFNVFCRSTTVTSRYGCELRRLLQLWQEGKACAPLLDTRFLTDLLDAIHVGTMVHRYTKCILVAIQIVIIGFCN